VLICLKFLGDTIQEASYSYDGLGDRIHAYGSDLTEMIKGGKNISSVYGSADISKAFLLPETGFGREFKNLLIQAINGYNAYIAAIRKKTAEVITGFYNNLMQHY